MRFFDAITFGAALAGLTMLGLSFLSPTIGLTLTPAVGFTVCGLALALGAGWVLLNPSFSRFEL